MSLEENEGRHPHDADLSWSKEKDQLTMEAPDGYPLGGSSDAVGVARSGLTYQGWSSIPPMLGTGGRFYSSQKTSIRSPPAALAKQGSGHHPQYLSSAQLGTWHSAVINIQL